MPSHVKTLNPSKVAKKLAKLKKTKLVNPSIRNGNREAEENSSYNEGKTQVIEQEQKFAHSLASNDQKVRTKVLKNLRKWLRLRSKGTFAFTDVDFQRLWKGMWMCMWMSDKLIAQEKQADDLANLIHCFDDINVAIQFFGNFMVTAEREWFGLDQWRLDKFMMLVRRVLRQMLFQLKEVHWSLDHITTFGDWLTKTVYNGRASIGLTMHFNDIYLEEIAKIGNAEIPEDSVHMFLDPCALFLAKSKDLRLIKHTKRNIFYRLLMQSSLGQEYQEKFDIWKRTGFPCENLNDLEIEMEVEEEEEEDDDQDDNETSDMENEEEERSLDVRAGRVSVVLEEIKFDARKIVEIFEKYRFKEFTNSNSRKNIKEIVLKYLQFADGEFPLGIKKMETARSVSQKLGSINYDDEAKNLLAYEESLAQTSANMPERVLKKLALKKKLTEADELTKPKKLKKKHNDVTPQGEWIEEDNVEESEGNKEHTQHTKINVILNKTVNEEEKHDKENEINGFNKTHTPTSDRKKVQLASTNKKLKNRLSLPNLNDTNEDPWSKPLEDGEVEMFYASRKKKLAEANELLESKTSKKLKKTKPKTSLVLNPFASSKEKSKSMFNVKADDISTPDKSINSKAMSSPQTGEKRVKIVLKKNTAQETHEYIAAIKNSPQVPYDSSKKPTKGLLKPNSVPSPINPFYKKRIGLKFNDTM